MAQPPEIVTDFSWRRSLGAILSAQLQDKVCKGRGAGNAENFSSGRRRRAAGPELGHLQEGVENLWRTGKEVTLRLPESPFFSGNPSNAYRKLSPDRRHLSFPLSDNYLSPLRAQGQWPCDGPENPATTIICHPESPIATTAGAWRSGGSRAKRGRPERSQAPAVVDSILGLGSAVSRHPAWSVWPPPPGSSARSAPRSHCDVPSDRSPPPSSSDP